MESVKVVGVAFADCPRLADLKVQAGIKELWATPLFLTKETETQRFSQVMVQTRWR